MPFAVGLWDVALILAVSVHATVLAYVPHPRAKAVLYAVPIPFTLATLALGQPIGTTHALGLLLLPLHPNGVRWLHIHGRLPVLAAIAVTAAAYCLVGAGLARSVPVNDATFWPALAAAFLAGLFLNWRLPHREERGHRSPLPIPLKFLLVTCIVTGLVMSKRWLQGFMAFFPMVGVVAAYEARYSLWTLGRQLPVFMLAMAPLLAVCRLTQDSLGLGSALAAGWTAFLIVLTPLTHRLWREAERQAQEEQDSRA